MKYPELYYNKAFFVFLRSLGAKLDHAFFAPLGGILELQFVLFRIKIRGIDIELLKDQGISSRAIGSKKKREGRN